MYKTLVTILLSLACTVVNAFEIISVDSVNVTVSYIEPSLNSNGTPLDDLSQTVVYYDLGNGEVEGLIVPASSPTGGTPQQVLVPVPIGTDQEADVSFYSVAFDVSGNRSGFSNVSTIRIDRLSPAPPQ